MNYFQWRSMETASLSFCVSCGCVCVCARLCEEIIHFFSVIMFAKKQQRASWSMLMVCVYVCACLSLSVHVWRVWVLPAFLCSRKLLLMSPRRSQWPHVALKAVHSINSQLILRKQCLGLDLELCWASAEVCTLVNAILGLYLSSNKPKQPMTN